MNRFSLDLVAKHFPAMPRALPEAAWTVLLEQSDNEGEAQARARFEALLEAALQAGTIDDAVVAASLTQSQALWHLRESIPLAQAQEGPNIKHDIALPVSAVAEFIDEAGGRLAAAFPGIRFVTFGHLGDGNLHYNLAAPEGVEAEAFLANSARVNRIVHDLVMARGGSISAEHGIGQQKREELVRYKDPVELELMRTLKSAIDPMGLFNPGKVL
jgi:FAD/FMN-containing dehydrogenase